MSAYLGLASILVKTLKNPGNYDNAKSYNNGPK